MHVLKGSRKHQIIEISNQNGCDKMVVISGVGVREYYRKIGYKKEGPFMVKWL